MTAAAITATVRSVADSSHVRRLGPRVVLSMQLQTKARPSVDATLKIQGVAVTSNNMSDERLDAATVLDGDLLWTPDAHRVAEAPISLYTSWLQTRLGRTFSSYEDLWRWSVTELDSFWGSLWHYFQVRSETPYHQVLNSRVMPGSRWFEGSRVNYAEHMLRYESVQPDKAALHYRSEARPAGVMSWSVLGHQVRTLATRLRELGIGPGDRVVAYLPNIPEAAIAMLATTAIGAIWSSAAPEFGVKMVLDRFAQIEPKLIFLADGYTYGGKTFFRLDEGRLIVRQLSSLEHIVWLPLLGHSGGRIDDALLWQDLMAGDVVSKQHFRYARVPHDHPLWILFSSGTTGLPKAIVHSHVGALMELLKLTALQFGLSETSVMFFYSTTGWIMWNVVLATLLVGGTAVLYDGHPTQPSAHILWRLAAETGTTCFGVSPTYVQVMQKSHLSPCMLCNLEHLKSIILTGSPSTPSMYRWLLRAVKGDLWINAISGGTELCGAFVGGAPTLPVYAGEMQARMLGMQVRCWSEQGRDLEDEVGELVVTAPFPSMPLFFWKDDGGKRYHDAYFDTFPGVWRHGDFIKINRRGGCYIYGRSDATLNRYGVRIGTAEIYRALERVEEVVDSIIVCCELPGGRFFMPLFLQLKAGCALDQPLCGRIIARLREDCSPRHVPDRMYAIDEIPLTLTGKKMEVPVRKILMGWAPETAASRDAMRNPEALDYFVRFAAESTDYQWRCPAASAEFKA